MPMKVLFYSICLFLCLFSSNAYSINIKFEKVDTVPVLVPYANYTAWTHLDSTLDTSTNCATLGGHAFIYSQADSISTNYINDTTPYLSTVIHNRICSRCYYEERQIYTFGTMFVNEPVNFGNIKKKKKKKTGKN